MVKPRYFPTISVALAGNPNSGKTSLFNEMVGANQRIGNFSGVTVEKIEGEVFVDGYRIVFVDLPGTYSLTAYSPEEVVARNYLIESKPDVVVNVVDATNLERNLYLTTQLMDLGANLLIALNMWDEAEKSGIILDLKQLQRLFGCHIVPTSARKKTGIDSLLKHIVRIYSNEIEIRKNKVIYQEWIEQGIDQLTKILSNDKDLTSKYPARWIAIKLLENDEIVYNTVKQRPIWIKLLKVLQEVNQQILNHLEEEADLVISENRHSFIRGALEETTIKKAKPQHSVSDLIDKLLINRITGLPVFLFIMWGIFQIIFKLGEYPMNLIQKFFDVLGIIATQYIENPLFESLIADGIIAGVGGVLVFLPVIMLLFFVLSFFEATGYMARAAFVIDKIMHLFGLHGKSFIPMITGFGCSVPAFMGTRVLKSNSDRITTLLVIPFMSCGAKLPVYTLIIGAFFPVHMAGNVLFAVYITGIFIALISAKIFKKALFKGESEPFVMELPPYRFPSIKSMLFQMWHKAKLYLKKAGTIILLASVIIWLASNFPKSMEKEKTMLSQKAIIERNENLTDTVKEKIIQEIKAEHAKDQIQNSLIGKLGKAIEPMIKPIGFDWKIGIGLLSGILGKEVFVSSLATIIAIGDSDPSAKNLRLALKRDPAYNLASAVALLLFVLLYIPCIAATVVFHREAANWRYTLIYVVYSLSIAWIISFMGYTITSLFV